jgi:hypothetical protein
MLPREPSKVLNINPTLVQNDKLQIYFNWLSPMNVSPSKLSLGGAPPQ